MLEPGIEEQGTRKVCFWLRQRPINIFETVVNATVLKVYFARVLSNTLIMAIIKIECIWLHIQIVSFLGFEIEISWIPKFENQQQEDEGS